MRSTPSVTLVATLLSLTLSACGGDKGDAKDAKDAKGADGKDAKGDGKGDAKGDAKGDDKGEPTLAVNEGDAAVPGPVPPETSAAFFVVEGALVPLGCFDKDKKKLEGGDACLAMVPAGTDVRLGSKFASFNKKTGDRVEPSCMGGSGKKVAIAVEGITEGADFTHATWPQSALKIVARSGDDTTRGPKLMLGDDDKSKLSAAIKAEGGEGDFMVNQVAEVDVDGDGKLDKLVAAWIADPSSDENYRWSGVFVAAGGDFNKMSLVFKVKNKPDVFEARGWLDLDGDKKLELWLRRQSQDGSAGDQLFTAPSGKWSGIGKWSCGAE